MYSSLKKYAGACIAFSIIHLIGAIMLFMYANGLSLGLFLIPLVIYLFAAPILFMLIAKALWDLQDEMHTQREVDYEENVKLRKRLEALEGALKK